MRSDFVDLRRPATWGLLFACWTALAAFFAGQVYLHNVYEGRPASWWSLLAVWLVCFYLWALLTPPIVRLALRFPLGREGYLKSVAVHLPAGVLLSLLQIGAYVVLSRLLFAAAVDPSALWRSFRGLVVEEFHASLVIYWSVVGLTHAYDYYRRYRERERRAAQLELEAAQLEAQLAQAQLEALRTQLHPHFLFNTLNTVSVLMQEDVSAANRTLVRLSELLRLTLRTTDAHEVPLKQELEFLRSYLEIEQTRFQNRLRVRMEIDPGALDAQVPNLLLQPLVENAIRHGIAPRTTTGTVEIRAARRNGAVELSVRDDGAGAEIESIKPNAAGVGLANTRARLRKLYGDAHRFDLAPAEGGGLAVTISIPFHTEARGNGRDDARGIGGADVDEDSRADS
jgi:sensor histidine kinase YesM